MRCNERRTQSGRRHLTPMPMEYPCILLAFLAAIFRAPTSPTLGKLARTLFPSAAFVVCALSNSTSGVVLSAKIPHDNAGPVLHICGVMTNSELLHERKNVEVIRQEVLLILLAFTFGLWLSVVDWLPVRKSGIVSNPQSWYQVRALKEGSEVTILRNIGEQLQRH